MTKRLSVIQVVIAAVFVVLTATMPARVYATDYGTYNGSALSWSGDFANPGFVFESGVRLKHYWVGGTCCDTDYIRTVPTLGPGTGDLVVTVDYACKYDSDAHSDPAGWTIMSWENYTAYPTKWPDIGFIVNNDHSARYARLGFEECAETSTCGVEHTGYCGNSSYSTYTYKMIVKKTGGVFLLINSGAWNYYYKDHSATQRVFTLAHMWPDQGGVYFADGAGNGQFTAVDNGSSPITITPTQSTIYIKPPTYPTSNPVISASVSGAGGTSKWRIDIIDASGYSVRGAPGPYSAAAYDGLPGFTDGTAVSFTWDMKDNGGAFVSAADYTARIAVVDPGNQEGQTANVALELDNTPPTSLVSALNPYYGNNTFAVSWTGDDSQIGIASYTLKAKKGTGGWSTVCTSPSTTTSCDFTPTGADTYYFEVCATDAFGNAETCSGTLEQSTIVETTPPTSSVNVLNPYYGNTTIPVSWFGSDTQIGMDSTPYTVKAKKDSAAWTTWLSNTADTSGFYTHSGAGVYYFDVCAVDAGGNAETCIGTLANMTTVDLTPPVSSGGGLNTYYGPDPFDVSWSATDLQDISCYEVKYRKDGGTWTDWPLLGCTGNLYSTFDHSGSGFYEFDIRATDVLGNVESFTGTADTSTTVEETLPVTSMTALNAYYGTGDITVSWSGFDPAPDNGIACYEVEVQKDGGGWGVWHSNCDLPPSITADYAHSGDGVYEFMTRARDVVGNWSASGAAQASTIVDATAPSTAVSALPLYNSGSTISVSWSGSDPNIGINPGSGLTCYDIQVNKDNGGWTDWLTCTTDLTDVYTHTGGGTYEFRSRATDNMGNIEGWPGLADASTVVDSTPPIFSYVNDGLGSDESFTGSASTLSANWSATDIESGVDHYEYAIGTSSGDNSLVDWTNIGTNTSVTDSTLTLVHNTTYYITIRAYNVAGYYSDQSTNGIKTDHNPPVVSMSEPNSAYMGALDFTVAWSATDGAGESGLQNFTAQYRDGAGGVWTDWTPSPTTDISRTFSGLHAHSYYFRVIAQDNMGNWSAYPVTPDYLKTTTVDTSQPSAPGGIADGSTTDADLDFIVDDSSLSAHWNAVVSTPGIQSYSYRIGTSAGAGDVIDWTETADTFFTETGLLLSEGSTYYITVKPKNLAGDFGYEGTSDGITIDLSSPTCAITALWEFQGNQSFSVQWSGTDNVSGIAAYDIQYKDGTDGVWTDWLSGTTLTSDLFSAQNKHTYYFQCRATDNAQLVSSYPGGDGDISTSVDTSIPAAPEPVIDGVSADKDYSSDTTSLSASWPSVTDAVGYKVCFGRGEIPDNCETMAWFDVGTNTTYEKTGLSLQHGETYFARVLAYNNANLEGAPGNSDGVLIDTAQSDVPVVSDDGDYFNTDGTVSAQWTASAGISGIVEYQYAVGTTGGGTDILTWTSSGIDTVATITGLPGFVQGKEYFISVKAKSGAGLWSEPGTSDGIIFDSVPPVCTVSSLIQYQSTESFNVSWSATDVVSGIAYLFDVQYRDGADGEWTTLLTSSSLQTTTFSGEDLHTYYFQCRAMDNTMNWSEYPGGDGDTSTSMDLTPPEPSPVRDGSGDDEVYTSSVTTLAANWDPVDGAVMYFYAIGTSAGATDIVDWTETTGTAFSLTNLTLVHGTSYYVAVKSRNNSGLISEEQYSDGILVDTEPSGVPVVADTGNYFNTDGTMVAQWTAAAGISGITEYQYAVGTTSGATDVADWTSNGNGVVATTTGLPGFVQGQEYYVSVKAKSGAGIWSEPGTSDGIIFDNVPPVCTVANLIQYQSTESFAVSWTASDEISGVANVYDVQYKDGTDGIWKNLLTASGLQETVFTGEDLHTYYFQCRAMDNISNWSEYPGGDGDTSTSMDLTPPKPSPVRDGVGDDEMYTGSDNYLSANWDPVDGAVMYLYAIGTSAGATDIVDWTGITGTSFQLSNLSLLDGTTYYTAVKSRNNSGLISEEQYSNGIFVDLTPPATPVVKDDGALTGESILNFVWTTRYENAPVSSHEYAVGSSPGNTDVRDWTAVTPDSNPQAAVAGISLTYSYTINDLTLVDGTAYYISVRTTDSVGNVSAAGESDGLTKTNTANLDVSYLPKDIKAVPESGKQVDVTVEFTFSESKGVGVSFDQLKEYFVLNSGMTIETPIQTTDFKIPGGSETKMNLVLTIPADVIAAAMGGRTTAVVTIRKSYTGVDDMQNPFVLDLEVPVSLTSAASDILFMVNSITLISPEDGSAILLAAGESLKGTVSVSGVGSVGGMWLLDDKPFKTFRKESTGDGSVSVELLLPVDMKGVHTAQLRVTMPEMFESKKVELLISDGEPSGSALADFMAGDVRITNVSATLDRVYNAWTGSGKVEIPVGDEVIAIDAPAHFEKLRINDEGGQKKLERGFLFVDTASTFENGPFKVEMDRVLVTTDRATADGKVTYLGTDDVMGVGPLYFYSADVGTSGIDGKVNLTSPQKGKIGVFQFAINNVDFKYGIDGVVLSAGGGFKTVPDPVLDFGLSIQASVDTASMNVVTGNDTTINLNGFDFKLDSGALVVENDQVIFKCSGNLDLSTAFGTPVNVKVADAKFYSSGHAELAGLESDEIDLGQFAARMDANSIITIEDVPKSQPSAGLNVNVALSGSAAGSSMESRADMNLTTGGIAKEVKLLPVAEGQTIASFESNGTVLNLQTGTLKFSDGKISSVKFSGVLILNGTELAMSDITLTDGGLSGSGAGAASVNAGGIALELSGNIDFSLGEEGFTVTAGEAAVVADSIIPGASGKLSLSKISFSEKGMTASLSARQEFGLLGSSIIVENAQVDVRGSSAEVTIDGAISMTDPNINIAFKGLTINSDGKVSGDIKADGSQTVDMFGLKFGIESFTLDLSGDALALKASGLASVNSESTPVPFNDLLISSGAVSGTLNVTADAPAKVEGFGGLSITRLDIVDNTLFMDGKLDLPAPLEKSVEFRDVSYDFSGKSDNVSGGTLIFEDASETPIKIKGFDFHVNRIAIPNPLGVDKASEIPETLAKVDLATSQTICGETMNIRIKGIEMTARGFRDVRLNVTGKTSEEMYSKVFPGDTGFTVAGLVFSIKNGVIDKFDIGGKMDFQGNAYEVPAIEITSEGTMEGAIKTGKGLSIDIDGVKLSARGDASFKLDASTECNGGMSVVLKDVEVDFSGPVGSSMKIKVPELAFENGKLSAAVDLKESFYISGVQFDITHATFTGSAGADGSYAYLRASFDGSISISKPSLKLAFEGLVVSSDGEIGGDIVVYGAQEFVAYGATFLIDGIRIAKYVAQDAATTGGGEALTIYTKGAVSFKQRSTIAFDKLMIAGGRIGGLIEVAEEEAAKAQWAENIGITKVHFMDGKILVSGFLDVGDPVNMKLKVEDIAIDYAGVVRGGKVILEGEEQSFSVGDFKIVISGTSYDIPSRILSIDGTLKLPSEITDASIDFTSLGISLAREGYTKIDSSRIKSDIKYLYDKQHILTMSIDRFAVGQKTDDIWYLTMSGDIALVVGSQTVMLNCERFTIFSNGQFDIKGVNGEIAVLIYKFVIENFSFNDEGNNPFIEMSGELDIPPYAAAKVDSFKRYKDGNIAFDEVMVYAAYGPIEFLLGLTYHFDAKREIERFKELMEQGGDSIGKVWGSDLNLVASYEEALNMITSTYGAYKDEEIAIEGTMFVNGTGVAVSGYYNPQEWAVDGDVCGLEKVLKIIHTCPVWVFDCLGGGVTYTFSGGLQGGNADAVANNSGGALSSGAVTELSHFIPDYLQVRLRTTAGFVNTAMDSISGQLSIDTQGMVGVEGDVTLMGMLKVGEGHMEFDPYNMYTYGYGEVQAELVDYFPIKLAKAGSVEFMFDADIGGSGNQSNSISDYGAWAFGAGAAAYKAGVASNNGQTSASNAGAIAVSGGMAAAGSLSDSSLGDSAWGKLLKGEWNGTSIDWWVKGGYDVDILGGIYKAHAQLTVDKDGWIYDFDVPFSVNISSDDVNRESGFDPANYGFGFDSIGIGGAHLTYGLKWDVGGVGISDGYGVEIADISAKAELFAEFDMDVTVDLKVAKVEKHMTLKWNNNGTIENVEDDYFEGTIPIKANYIQELPFPSCSVSWHECNCHTVKYKECWAWDCKTKSKTVCGSCPSFYDCPPDTFFKPRSFDKDLYLRLDRNGFKASFK